jgi:hypothetical protein
MAREKVAVTDVAFETSIAASAGDLEVTVGGGPIVVNAQLTAAASGAPADDLTVVSSAAVYVTPFARAALGVSVAVCEAAS